MSIINGVLSSLPRARQRIASRVFVEPTAPSPDRSGIVAVAIVRDEEAHIGHWLEFHKLAGIRDFILYDNDCSDRTTDVAMSIPDVNVTVVPWHLKPFSRVGNQLLHRQVLAYTHAIASFGAGFRWMTFLDIDEYVYPTSDESLQHSLQRLEHWTNVSLPWTMYGPSGHRLRPDTSPVDAYCERAAERTGSLLNFKCIVDPCDVTMVSVHKFWTRSMGEDSVNCEGERAHYKRRASGSFVSADAIRLNHYCTLSEEEFAAKLSKGAVSGMESGKRQKLLMNWHSALSGNTVFDDSARQFLLERRARSAADNVRSIAQ